MENGQWDMAELAGEMTISGFKGRGFREDSCRCVLYTQMEVVVKICSGFQNYLSLNCWFPAALGGSGGFQKLLKACRITFHPKGKCSTTNKKTV